MDDQLRCCTSSNTLSLVNFSTKSVTGVTRPTQLRRRRTTKLRLVRGDKQTVTRDVRKVNKYGDGRNKQQAGYCTGRNVSKKYFRRKLIHAIIPSSESEGLQVISDSHWSIESPPRNARDRNPTIALYSLPDPPSLVVNLMIISSCTAPGSTIVTASLTW
jgi:hypothetical protein